MSFRTEGLDFDIHTTNADNLLTYPVIFHVSNLPCGLTLHFQEVKLKPSLLHLMWFAKQGGLVISTLTKFHFTCNVMKFLEFVAICHKTDLTEQTLPRQSQDQYINFLRILPYFSPWYWEISKVFGTAIGNQETYV